MEELSGRLRSVGERVRRACESVGRDPAEVSTLLATKGQPVEVVRHALELGHQLIGHNRAQELIAQEAELADVRHQTHFIGQLQSNKAAKVVPLVDAVHSLDRFSLAERLNRLAGEVDRTLGVFVQVNTSFEPSKAGVSPEDAQSLAASVGLCDRLVLRGFMTVGANSLDIDEVRRSYERLAAIRDEVLSSGAPGTAGACELSMGMSGDLEIAIASGATMVRVGSAAFGPRIL